MATPKRNLILENIECVLRNIKVGQGFKTDVDTVEREIKDWDSAKPGQMPWLGYMPRRSIYEHDPFEGMNVTMPVSIVGHVNAATAAEKSELASELMDDVIRALQLDTNRDGNAVMTTIREEETDEGDPDTMNSRGGSGTFELVAEVFYLRSTAGS